MGSKNAKLNFVDTDSNANAANGQNIEGNKDERNQKLLSLFYGQTVKKIKEVTQNNNRSQPTQADKYQTKSSLNKKVRTINTNLNSKSRTTQNSPTNFPESPVLGYQLPDIFTSKRQIQKPKKKFEVNYHPDDYVDNDPSSMAYQAFSKAKINLAPTSFGRSSRFKLGRDAPNVPSAAEEFHLPTLESQKNKPKLLKSLSPEPGQYNAHKINSISSRAKKVFPTKTTFGVSNRPDPATGLPGPGSYDAPSSFKTANHKKGPMHQKKGRFEDVEYKPGPGDYEQDIRKKNPNLIGTTMGLSERFGNPEDTPGPGEYDHLEVEVYKKNAKSSMHSIGYAGRFQEQKEYSPGPQDYETTANLKHLSGKSTTGIRIGNSKRKDVFRPAYY